MSKKIKLYPIEVDKLEDKLIRTYMLKYDIKSKTACIPRIIRELAKKDGLLGDDE